MLYGVFLASSALLMDAYINGSGSLQDKIRHSDVAETLRIVEGARSHSWAAASLHESLTQILAKYHAQQQQRQPMQEVQIPILTAGVSSATSTPVINAATTQMALSDDQLAMMPTPRGMGDEITMGPILDQMPLPISQPQYYNLAQILKELMYTDGFQWDDLFSGIASESIF
jgi:hypothetical protein